MRYCKKCYGKVVLHAFSFGECLVCNDNISTGHIPCDVICPICSEDFNLCESCSNSFKNE